MKRSTPSNIFVSIVLLQSLQFWCSCHGTRIGRQIGFGGSSSGDSGTDDEFRRALQDDQDQNQVSLKSNIFGGADNTNLGDFLRENGEDVDTFSRTSFSFPNSGSRGNPCRTPFGSRGTCSYINDDDCSPIRRYLFIPRYRRAVINYIRNAIRPPCGFDNGDFTMCCRTRRNSRPRPTSRPTTTTTTTATTTTTTRRPSETCGLTTGTRIVGGEIATPGSWPWQVALGQPKRPTSSSPTNFRIICGGTLISPTHVLSAAHCFTSGSTRNTPTMMRFGEHDLSTENELGGTFDRDIAGVLTHQGFSTVTLVNDLAVVKIAGNPIRYTTSIRAACLPYDYAGVRDTSLPEPFITGWGALDDGQRSVNRLRQAQVPIVSHTACKNSYSNVRRITITKDQICAGRGNTDTCAGDSGGPLVSDAIGRRWSIIGVTSYGVECGSSRHPGVYVRIDKYLDWIQDRMRDLDNGRGSTNNRNPGGTSSTNLGDNSSIVRFGG